MTWRTTFLSHWWLCVFILLMSACSLPSINSKREPKDPFASERGLGYIALSSHEEAPRLLAYKIRKGYALKGNLHQQKDSRLDFVISKSKEYKWFSGLQWRYEF